MTWCSSTYTCLAERRSRDGPNSCGRMAIIPRMRAMHDGPSSCGRASARVWWIAKPDACLPSDRATVFDQPESVSLHVAGDFSRLRKSGQLVEATALDVVVLDLDGQVFEPLCCEFRQPGGEQPPPDAAPLPVRQDVDPGELHRLCRPAHELCESNDIATRFGDEEARSLCRERVTQALP